MLENFAGRNSASFKLRAGKPHTWRTVPKRKNNTPKPSARGNATSEWPEMAAMRKAVFICLFWTCCDKVVGARCLCRGFPCLPIHKQRFLRKTTYQEQNKASLRYGQCYNRTQCSLTRSREAKQASMTAWHDPRCYSLFGSCLVLCILVPLGRRQPPKAWSKCPAASNKHGTATSAKHVAKKLCMYIHI